MAEAPRNLICSRQVAEVLVQLPVLHEVLALVVEEEPVAFLLTPSLQFVRKFIISQQDLRDRVHDLVAGEVGGRILVVKDYDHSPVPTGAKAAPPGVIAPQNSSRLSAPGKVDRCVAGSGAARRFGWAIS